MAASTPPDLLSVFDRAPLNRRYWTSFLLLAGVYVLDFFDFFLIAFVLAVIGPQWHLTYGQAALILYGSGLGKILGPLALAVIAGTGNMLRPQATAEAVFPAFLFLACCMLLVGLAFVFLGRETHGRSMALDIEGGARPVRSEAR